MTTNEIVRTQSDLSIDTDARSGLPYDQWIASLDVPVHKGYFIEDTRDLEVAPWPQFGCNAAFIQLEGMQGTADARITEIGPGDTMPPVRFALDEVVYVADGHGMTTV